MYNDDNIWLLTADLGFGLWDNIRDFFPSRFINIGAAEQALIDIGIGLALQGKIPICYSITPFLIYRPFESLRTYIDYEKIPVKLVGGGRDKDYENEGISHWAYDDIKILGTLSNIELYKPDTINEKFIYDILYNNNPIYLNLKAK